MVEGVLRPEWSEWFVGFDVLPGVPAPGETTLSGPVVDQAALHGLLARIRDLGLPLVSAIVVPGAPEERPGVRY